MNFNGGDRLFRRLSGIDFLGTLEEWPQALAQIIADKQITDVTLFGDCRDNHMIATRVCRELQIPIHVFEEGYIRPDWVTFERDGMNGHSSLARDPQWYLDKAAKLPPVEQHLPLPSTFRRRALEGLAYNFADVFSRWHYKNLNNHRPWHPLVEGMGWLRELRRGKEREAQGAELLQRLKDSRARDFLFLR
ncbi:hypothetical protein [Novosphingobium sp. B1]|uniref:capsular polysaccharide export protein, LipB/KpsS family n=1 Tax=Novosphingobium sp. B1 TaxID=1938756 RepID=UPI0009D7F827|nr:hypothetical protein [Novosphingobium sp. B1]SMD04114.1 Capsule polysaccharide biosynthesis protein [Novosphingobium sp. B1]